VTGRAGQPGYVGGMKCVDATRGSGRRVTLFSKIETVTVFFENWNSVLVPARVPFRYKL
jgi:hypothetical protein